ncbi:hypothetical protein RI367_005999 [Sorochytrium milnesiophthora]
MATTSATASMNGEGTYVWPSGTRFSGSFKGGKLDGSGVFDYANGCRYEGHVKDNLRNGTGVLQSSSSLGGKSYRGSWKDSKMHGEGCVVYAESPLSMHFGRFQNGVCHGVGTRVYPSGSMYSGEWQDNERHGQGRMVWRRPVASAETLGLAVATTTIAADDPADVARYEQALAAGHEVYAVYEGEWAHGKVHGRGRYVWVERGESDASEDGKALSSWYPFLNSYTGDFVDGQRHGFGTFHYADGSLYRGEWRQGRKHGTGEYITPEGRRYSGGWADDTMLEDFAAFGQDYSFAIADLLPPAVVAATAEKNVPTPPQQAQPAVTGRRGSIRVRAGEHNLQRRMTVVSTSHLPNTLPQDGTQTSLTTLHPAPSITLASSPALSQPPHAMSAVKRLTVADCQRELNNVVRRHVTLLRRVYSRYAKHANETSETHSPHIVCIEARLGPSVACTTTVRLFSGMTREQLWRLLRDCEVAKVFRMANVNRLLSAPYRPAAPPAGATSAIHTEALDERWVSPHNGSHTLTFREFCEALARVATVLHPRVAVDQAQSERGPAGSFSYFIEHELVPREAILLSGGEWSPTFKALKRKYGYAVYTIHAARAAPPQSLSPAVKRCGEFDVTVTVRELMLMLQDCELLAPHTRLTHTRAIHAIAVHVPPVLQEGCVVLEHELVALKTFCALMQCFYELAHLDVKAAAAAAHCEIGAANNRLATPTPTAAATRAASAPTHSAPSDEHPPQQQQQQLPLPGLPSEKLHSFEALRPFQSLSLLRSESTASASSWAADKLDLMVNVCPAADNESGEYSFMTAEVVAVMHTLFDKLVDWHSRPHFLT